MTIIENWTETITEINIVNFFNKKEIFSWKEQWKAN